tara:strand:- start:130 stop:2274 length:2145 start_codon:yes stop_codon:yes gene_type:complete
MQQLQLYIGTERVELFKDETVSLTQTIQNVRDIKKIFTEFTKTFSVPASKTNNLIFKHYYNFNIDNAFDARRKATASLELNGILFKEGKITLEGVDLKNNLAHTYRITFYGKTVNLKDILGDDQLSGLSGLDQYNQLYTPADVTTSMQDYTASTNDNILVPLISQLDRMIYDSGSTATSEVFKNIAPSSASPTLNGIEWSQFKYAIRVQAIIDAIEEKYTIANGYESDIVFSNDFFNKTYPTNGAFTGLFMWLHRKKGDVSTSSQIDVSWSQVNDLAQVTCGPVQGCVNNSTVTNGILNVNPFSGYVVYGATLILTPDVSLPLQDYSVRVLRNDVQIAGFNNLQGPQTISITSIDNGEYIVQIASATTLTFTGVSWTVNWGNITTFQGGYNTYNLPYPTTFDTSLNVEFNISEQIPKMTVIKFLEGIFQMFNLTAYIENEIIVVKPLNSYYNFVYNNSNINIDQYLDVGKSSVNTALPFKKVNFLYKGTKTFLANQFEQVNNTAWGSLSYTLNEQVYDAPSESYSIELPFEHMMYERLYDVTAPQPSTTVQWGYFVNDNQESYFGSPLLFYPIRQTSATSIVIRNGGTSQEISSYFVPSNSLVLDPTASKVNIHFNNYINEWEANEDGSLQNDFTDTLFKTEYKTYMESIFNEKQRLTTVTAYLPYKIFSSLKLNNVIELGQNRYFINSMTTNLINGKTKFELLNNFLAVPDPF